MTEEGLKPYHDQLERLGALLSEQGSLGLVVIDAGALVAIEHEYGSATLDSVRQRIMAVLAENRGKGFRKEDIWAVDAPRGLRLLLFLDRKRRKNVPVTPADFKVIAARLSASVLPSLERIARPYCTQVPQIDLGFSLAINNPLLRPERVVQRALEQALEVAAHQRTTTELQVRERLQDIIVRERILTAYQPIMLLKDRTVLGYEALTRGVRGCGLEEADALFGAAARHGLLIELDRLCRSRALLGSARLPVHARVFVNTLPATIHDPQFRGRALIDFLERAHLSPDRLVIEITEKLVIDNYTLFRESMAYFTDLGVSLAVDDVGAGYSGLESIASLKPHFLKIDTVLSRDVHMSTINQAIVKSILAIARDIGATVIAEGIQSPDEAKALEALGVDFGQGFYLARPDSGE
jgi:EAL domain-containing protein (putative c-di-GMP-specific phosphodiesterase class I)